MTKLKPNIQSRPRRLTTIVTLIVLLALGGHFSIVWLYLTPTNPLKLALWGPVHEYIHPLFVQNWQLFAPMPAVHDELMLIKLRWREDAAGRAWESEWVDITTPIHIGIHNTRISPYSKLARPYTGILDMLMYTDSFEEKTRKRMMRITLEQWEQNRNDVGLQTKEKLTDSISNLPTPLQLDSLLHLSEHELKQRRYGYEMMYRLASAYGRNMVADDGKLLAVNVRYAIHLFPQFSQRYNSSAEGKTLYSKPFGWEKPNYQVALP